VWCVIEIGFSLLCLLFGSLLLLVHRAVMFAIAQLSCYQLVTSLCGSTRPKTTELRITQTTPHNGLGQGPSRSPVDHTQRRAMCRARWRSIGREGVARSIGVSWYSYIKISILSPSSSLPFSFYCMKWQWQTDRQTDKLKHTLESPTHATALPPDRMKFRELGCSACWCFWAFKRN